MTMELVRKSLGGSMDRALPSRELVRPLLAGGVASAVALVAFVWFSMHPGGRSLSVESWKIKVSTVSAAPFHDFIPLRGLAVPLDSVVLDAIQGGRVEAVLAEAGQRVVAGQPLIRLSDPSLELDAIARETQVIEQMDSQRSLQLNFELAKTADIKAVADADYNILRLGQQLARRRPLAAKGFEALEVLEQKADELAYQKRLRSVAADALQRDAAVIQNSSGMIAQTAARLDANLAAARRQLDVLTLRAPADGVLTGLEAHVGEEKARGQHLGQIDLDAGFKVAAEIDEFYLARVKPEQRVSVSIDGTPAALVVRKVYPQVKAGRFAVDLTWEGGSPPGLRRGQAVQGKLELGDDAPAVVLPTGPFLEASGGAWIFVLDPDGRAAMRRPVKLGRRNAESVEVLGGLEPGERVVTSDYTGLDRIDQLVISP
jgi:HlyD family secretion protein